MNRTLLQWPIAGTGGGLYFNIYRLLVIRPNWGNRPSQIIQLKIENNTNMNTDKGNPHYRPWRPDGDVDARVHIFAARALLRRRVASLMLGHLYPPGKVPVLILQEAELTPGPVWIRSSEEKSPPLLHPGLNPQAVQPTAKFLTTWANWQIYKVKWKRTQNKYKN